MEVQALHEARYACVGRGSGEQEQLDQKYGGGVLKRQGTKECVCVRDRESRERETDRKRRVESIPIITSHHQLMVVK